MRLPEIFKMYNKDVDLISIITTEEVEWRLTVHLKLKKSDFTDGEWQRIIKKCTLSIRDYIKYSKIGELIKRDVQNLFPNRAILSKVDLNKTVSISHAP